MKSELRLRDIAVLEDLTLRQVQRWIRAGDLCSFISGKGRMVRREDYLAWKQKREALKQPKQGQVAPVAAPEPTREEILPRTAPEPREDSSLPPAIFRPANPGGPLTNVPHPTSGNMPSPETVREFAEGCARHLIQSILEGKEPDDYKRVLEPEEKEHDNYDI